MKERKEKGMEKKGRRERITLEKLRKRKGQKKNKLGEMIHYMENDIQLCQ